MFKVAFIGAAIKVEYNSFPMLLPLLRNLAKIDSIFIFFYLEIFRVHLSNELTFGFVLPNNPSCITLAKIDIDGMNWSFSRKHKIAGISSYRNLSDLGSLHILIFLLGLCFWFIGFG